MYDNRILFKSMSLRRSWALGYIVVIIIIIFLTGHALKVSLNICVHTHRLGLLSTLAREAASFWQWTAAIWSRE